MHSSSIRRFIGLLQSMAAVMLATQAVIAVLFRVFPNRDAPFTIPENVGTFFLSLSLLLMWLSGMILLFPRYSRPVKRISVGVVFFWGVSYWLITRHSFFPGELSYPFSGHELMNWYTIRFAPLLSLVEIALPPRPDRAGYEVPKPG